MWEHKQYAIGYALEPVATFDPVETYVRPWRERLLSWPWRPWVRLGVRRAAWVRMAELREQTLNEMRRNTNTDLFAALDLEPRPPPE